MNIIFKLILLGVCSQLWYLGGMYRGRYRDVPIPIIIGLVTGFITVWWLGIIACITYQVMRMGYGRYDPKDTKLSFLATLIKDESGEVIQASHGLLVSLIGASPLALYTGNWLFYGVYVFVNTLARYLLTKFDIPIQIDNRVVGALVYAIAFIK